MRSKVAALAGLIATAALTHIAYAADAPPAPSADPADIHFKGVTLTPGGFIEAAALYRSANENADIGSTYGNVPFDGSANSNLSEFRGSARQSRLSLLVGAKAGDSKVSSYYEMDFLGAAPTANEVESNSFNMRQRQLWARVETPGGTAFTAGQSWSLLTLNRNGVTPRAEWIPATIDAQYVVGYNWARQWNLRLAQRLGTGNKAWFAIAVENPETTLGVVNAPAGVFGFNTSPNATSPSSLLTLNNTPGANGVSTDAAPDVVGKLAFEPGWGHFEVKGVARFFRDRINGSNNTTTGGGIGAGAVLPVGGKKADLILEGLVGSGIGRYAAGVGSDVTLDPAGNVEAIKAWHGLAGLELHPTPALDVYGYFGIEHYDQNDFVNSAGKGVGYGSPLNDTSGCSLESPSATQGCQAQTKQLWQFQPGFWYRFHKGPEGTVQFGASYSYTKKETWAGTAGAPEGSDSIFMGSFRYVFP
jgi:hypothetical protein